MNLRNDDNNNKNNYVKEERIEKEEEPIPSYNGELNKSSNRNQNKRDNDYK